MHSAARPVFRLLATLLALCALVALLIAVPATRSLLVSAALRAGLWTQGYHMDAGRVWFAHDLLSIQRLAVSDDDRNPFLSADRVTVGIEPRGLLGFSDRWYGLRWVSLVRPHFYLLRHNDGTWNFQRLIPKAAPTPAPGRHGPPVRLRISVTQGRIDFIDRSASAPVGKSFTVANIQLALKIDRGAQSGGTLTAQLQTARGSAPLRGALFEDDRVAFGRGTLDVSGAPIAPIIDTFVPSPSFVMQGGFVDVHMLMYAAGYDPAAGPRWHVGGQALVRAARLHVSPLVLPMRDIACRLRFANGLLAMEDVRGWAAGLPMRAQGALTLVGTPRLFFGLVTQGRLEQARTLFAFTKGQDLSGPFSAQVRVGGLLKTAHVGGFVEMREARYAVAALPDLRSTFFVSGNHIVVSVQDLGHGGARMWAQGDFDISSKLTPMQALITASIPSNQIPFAGNVIENSTVQGAITLQGPISALTTDGFAQVSGGGRNRLRAFFGADNQLVTLGPVLYEHQGGEALVWAARTQDASRTVSARIIASHIPLSVHGGQKALADVSGAALSLPSLDTVLDGTAFLFGHQTVSDLAVSATASNLVFRGLPLGQARLAAAGRGGAIDIQRATLEGPAAQLSASGLLLLGVHSKLGSTLLQGEGSVDLSRFASAFPGLKPSGTASGAFTVTTSGPSWLLAAQAHSRNASISGIPLRGGTVFAGRSSGSTSVLADVVIPHGNVWAMGTLNRQSLTDAPSGRMIAIVPALPFADLGALRMARASGSAAGFADVAGTLPAMQVHAAAVLRGSYDADPFAGDIDLRYANERLASNASRLVFEGNQAVVDGAIAGLGAGRGVSDAALSLDVHIREGDLAAANRFTGKEAPITGSFDADAHFGGSLRRPMVNGYIDTDLGTLRGVAFDELHGRLAMRPGAIVLRDGSVELGTSSFTLAADGGPGGYRVSGQSPRVDMSDFNDFFAGKDVFAGIGSFDVDVTSDARGLDASGRAYLDDAALRDYQLGHIGTVFSSRGSTVAGYIDQTGPGGAAKIAGQMVFHEISDGLPNFATASYRVRVSLRNFALDEALPLLHQENLGLSGFLDADGSLLGTLRKPTGDATFVLRDGYLRRIPIRSFSAALVADERHVKLIRGLLELPFLSAQGSGSMQFVGRTLSGNASLDVSDLSALANDLRVPGSLAGAARGQLSLSGSLGKLKASANLEATHTKFFNVAFDTADLHAQYAPGQVSIGDSSLTFAGNRGQVTIAGNLPVQLHPLALGPRERPIGLAVSAKSMDLGVLDPLTRGFASLQGTLDAQASLSGTAGNPVGKGSARMRGASLHSPLESVPLTDASADLSFENDTITLHRLHGTIGPGSVDMQGAAHIVPAVGLRTYAGLQLWSRVGMHAAQVNFPNWLSGTLDGTLSFTRSGTTPYVAGNVSVSNANIPFAAVYELAQGGALAARSQQQPPGVPPLLPGHTIVYGGGTWGPISHTLTTIGQPTPAPAGLNLPSINLNVALGAKNNVRIKGGSDVDLTTTGSIVLAGNLLAPTLNGQFQAVRGQVGYFDTTFRLVSGTVTFDPSEGLLPTLNAVAVTNISGEEITLTVTGRVDNMNTDLSANPPLSRDEIIATLLHTPLVASLTSGPTQAQTTLVQTAQNYFNAQLSRSLLYPVESALAQELNVESISLIFNQYGNLAVEIRTRFSPAVSAVYQSSLSAPVVSAYGMSYRLQDFLALDVLQSSQPDYGLYNTVFNFRYTFR